MRRRSPTETPEALRRHNEAQLRVPDDVVSRLGRRARVVALWRRHDDDPERWIYLERMAPEAFSMEMVRNRWGGGGYRIRIFGDWDGARRQEKYITQVAFWIWNGFPPTEALETRLRAAASKP